MKWISVLFLVLFLSGCGDDKEIHACDFYGLDNQWCDAEGRTNVCTIEEGELKWIAFKCPENWFCDGEAGDCRCTPGDSWCAPGASLHGLDAAMVCQDDGRVAFGPVCYGGCAYEDDAPMCVSGD